MDAGSGIRVSAPKMSSKFSVQSAANSSV